MDVFDPFLIGVSVALAAGAVGVMAVLQGAARRQFVYAQLCVMVGIYVGFAIAGVDGKEFLTRSDFSAVIVESVAALIFILAGLAALGSRRVWMLGGLILAHGAVDLLHLIIDNAAGPAWYAFACILYDAIVGTAAVVFLSGKTSES